MSFISTVWPFQLPQELLENRGLQAWMLLLSFSVMAYATSGVVTAVYRLYFHPLASFPGVRAACLSEKWCYDQTRAGFPEKVFEKLHDQFGTKALRVGPNELHISDVHQYRIIYGQRTPFLKYAAFYDGFGTPHTLFAETDPALHRKRRQLLNSTFSRTSILKLEAVIHEKLEVLTRKSYRHCKTSPINVYDAFRCLTTDIMSDFTFARSAGLIEESQDSFKASFLTGFDVASKSIIEMQYRQNFRRISSLIPQGVLKNLSTELGAFVSILEFAESSLRHFQERGNNTSHPIVLESLTRLPDGLQITEALDILIAGSDTTASTLTVALYHILSNREVEQKLVAALMCAVPGNSKSLSLLELEQIDYLNGCVKEALRMRMAVPDLLPRVVPGGDAPPLIVDGKVVPPGTVVGISTYTMHTCEELWGADARSFVPERWKGGADAKVLDQYLCSFSKGPRMCIGQNVAVAVITTVLGNLFLKSKLHLAENAEASDGEDAFSLQYRERGLDVHLTPL